MLQKHIHVIALILFGATPALPQVSLNQSPSRAIGQPHLIPSSLNANLVEGRELFQPQSVALDTTVTPPILYVSDRGNNRVLAWKDAKGFSNGKPADLVIGQRDFISTFAQGPGISPFSAGLSSPMGIAVLNSDLYVVDAGNNRVLRFRKPFATASDQLIPDLVIGQTSLNTRASNSPNGSVNERGIFLAGNNNVAQANIAFDTTGNLWLTDGGNHRVLRYDAADISKSNTFGPAAKLELGQLDFVSVAAALQSRQIKNQFVFPSGLGFDSAGRLYVGDTDRVLVFSQPFGSGMSASRIMGVIPQPAPGAPNPPQSQIDNTSLSNPLGVFALPGNNGIGVVDSNYSRILIFDPFDQWPDENTTYSPQAKAVVGQANNFHIVGLNNNNPASSASTLSFPAGAVLSASELYVADAGNNRVIVLPLQGFIFGNATRVLGQDRFDTNSINLIEGREFQFVATSTQGTLADAGLAIDSTTDTPHLYVADPYNNRVLGFKDMRKLKPGDRADIVLGQPDMATAICNYPGGDPNAPTPSSLCAPTGLLLDSAGNLYVADTANGRVLRFPAPFARQATLEQADLVLGQPDFKTKFTDPGQRSMAGPYGLAFAGSNGLLVSDIVHNRVLFFKFTGNGTFTAATDNGLAATKVFGQPDFISTTKGTADTAMSSPHHLASDTDGRPYVVDSNNGRVLIFDQILNTPDRGAHAAIIISGLNTPRGIYVNPLSGEIWVTTDNRALRYPKFDALQFNNASNYTIQAFTNTLAVVQDQFGDLVLADAANRVTFYFPGLSGVNGVNFLPNRPLAPGLLATLFPATGAQFNKDVQLFSDLPNPVPYPKTLGDVQVLFNDAPAPLLYAGPTQVNFEVPMGAPTTGTADVQVVKFSTGQILAAGTVAMNSVSPAIFTATTTPGIRQALVLNQDNSVNTTTNPAKRGEIIQIYASGQGAVSPAPPDGDIPQGLVQTPYTPRVLIGTCFVDTCPLQPGENPPPAVEFSGLSPIYPGVWQINVRIPLVTAPDLQTFIAISVNSVGSNDPAVFRTVIAVKQ